MNTQLAYLRGLTIEELITAYQGGNPLAFDVLIGLIERRKKILLHLKLRNAEREKEVWQRIIIKVSDRLLAHAYHEAGKFDGWFNRIMNSQVLDVIKAKPVKDRQPLEEEPEDNSTEESIFHDDRLEKLRPFIAQLGEKTRTIFFQYIDEGMSLPEIAAARGVSTATVYTLYHRGIAILKAAVSSHKKIFS